MDSETKKSIGIVVDSLQGAAVAESIIQDLRYVFGSLLDMNPYYLSELNPGDRIGDDLVLAMLPNRAVRIAPYVDDPDRIMVVHRTILERNAYQLFEIPAKSRVLAVNDYPETTRELVSLLYRIGVDHLDLVAYDPHDLDPSIRIAITPNEERLVPSFIERTINVGDRCVDAETFLSIIHRLGLDHGDLAERLISYFNIIVSLNTGIKSQYKDYHILNEQLNSVLNFSGEALAIVNPDMRIRYYNGKFAELFPSDALGRQARMEQVVGRRLARLLKKSQRLDQKLYRDEVKSFTVTKLPLVYFGENNGYYLNFREVEYIKGLERNLSKQLKKKGLVARYGFDDLVYFSEQMDAAVKRARKIADSDLTVLITGESGAGKELFGQSIHNYSPRRNRPFVALNCAALPESLLESELFGYEKGAFTGARREGKIGLIEQAHHGTLFLDEIGDTPLSLQARLLRVIQERQVMRLGSDSIIDVDIRIISAANKDLKALCGEGRFRTDLYHRLNVLSLNIPPLRSRPEDILPLFRHFVGQSAGFLDKETEGLLLSYDWPGNVRELENAAAYYCLMNELKEDILHGAAQGEGDVSGGRPGLEQRLCARVDRGVLLAVLEALAMDKTRGLGRGALLKLLAYKGLEVGEGRLRGLMSLMVEEGLLEAGRGRAGSRLTPKGESLVDRMRSRVR